MPYFLKIGIWLNFSLAFLLISVLFPTSVQAASASPVATFEAYSAQTMGISEENRSVDDVEAAFDALKHHGEALGWRNPEDEGAPDPSSSDHYQGLVRYPGKGTPIFYVTHKDDDDDILPGASDKGGYLHIVRLGTRSTTGERLRSNLQVIGKDTAETEPDPTDTWLKSIRFDGSIVIDGSNLPAYEHPGCMAIMEDFLFVPLDTPRSGSSPTGQIVLFDLKNDRKDPTPIQAIALDHAIDNLAVFKSNGDYIVWVNGDGGKVTKFYKTSHSDLRDNSLDLIEIQNWDPDSNDDYNSNGSSWPTGKGAHQSSAVIQENGGLLYLIGMRVPGGLVWGGDDYADLYRLNSKSGGGFKLTFLATKHFYCVYDGGSSGTGDDMRIGNFAAAGNAYVSPSGELILYSIPHDDEDWADPDFTKLGEFRHRDVNRENSPLRLPTADANGPYTVNEGETVTLSGVGDIPADRPWVELYDDDHWEDRSIVVDYDDRTDMELDNFNNLDNFNDKTTSIRWRLPVGLDIELYDDDNFRDRYIILRGTGKTEYIAHLKNQVVVPGVVEHPGKSSGEKLDFNGKTSSMRFTGTPLSSSPDINWDLDGDGLFGESGPSATYGDEAGANPVLDASYLDGPSSINVTLKVVVSGISATDNAVIQVMNVAPTVEAGPDLTIYSGDTASVNATFTDPGILDTHTATIDWGDGAPAEPAEVSESGGSGNATGTHTYFVPGDYTVTVEVTDDEGASSSDSFTVTVLYVPVVIDIKPGSDSNPINLNSNGVIPVAILTDNDFDASTVDVSTVRFGPAEAAPVQYAMEDVDHDGDADMILHFRTQEIGLEEKDTEAILTGQTIDGIYFIGKDTVRIVPSKDKPNPPGKDEAPGQNKEPGDNADGNAKGKDDAPGQNKEPGDSANGKGKDDAPGQNKTP